jgi:hypothetical protein
MRDNLLTVGPDPVIRQKVAKRTWRGRDGGETAIASGGEEVVGQVKAMPDYQEFIGAKKHLVLGLLPNSG